MSDEEKDSDGGEEPKELGECNPVENKGHEMVPRKRVKNKMLTDRLSGLPDCLCIHILSYLGVKKAAITSVLSKRWQYLWAELPELDFRDRCSWDVETTRRLVTWINQALSSRTTNYLDELDISITYDDCFAPDVDSWIEFAVRNNVKQLHLELHGRRADVFYTLPQLIYSCSSLTSLWLQRCIVSPEKKVDWKNLTELGIQDVELHEPAIEKMLSGCPVLGKLYLAGCWGFEHLNIDSGEHLYHLTVEDSDYERTGDLLEISAPNIRYLRFAPFLIEMKEVRIKNVPSLAYADVQFLITAKGVGEEEMVAMMNFFEEIKHVKELRVGRHCIHVLAKLAKCRWQLPKSISREHLTIEPWRDGYCLSGIIVLLESSPNLETLVIRCNADSEEVDWGAPRARSDLDCDFLRLKTITLRNYANPKIRGEPMLTMARTLLNRATALEEMVVDARGNLIDYPSVFHEISEEVLSYPRSSPNAVVVLHP